MQVDLNISLIHVLRNPYDMVATTSLRAIAAQAPTLLAMNSSSPAGRIALSTVVVDAPDVVDYATEVFVQRAEALLRLRDCVLRRARGCQHLRWLDLGFEALVAAPDPALRALCEFLALPCPPLYRRRAAAAVSSTLTAPRRRLRWPPPAVAAIAALLRHTPWRAQGYQL